MTLLHYTILHETPTSLAKFSLLNMTKSLSIYIFFSQSANFHTRLVEFSKLEHAISVNTA